VFLRLDELDALTLVLEAKGRPAALFTLLLGGQHRVGERHFGVSFGLSGFVVRSGLGVLFAQVALDPNDLDYRLRDKARSYLLRRCARWDGTRLHVHPGPPTSRTDSRKPTRLPSPAKRRILHARFRASDRRPGPSARRPVPVSRRPPRRLTLAFPLPWLGLPLAFNSRRVERLVRAVARPARIRG
jgi:hypothetical protein